MDVQVLVDSIMRQTTVLIAQLSSAAGVRAPLSHVADEVFLNLSRELEAQGLSRKVVADMFGLALRGYQRRVQRLSESQTERGITLWQAVLDFVEKEGPVARRRVSERFQYDDAPAVGAVLKDLCESGLVSRTGTGEQTLYRVTQENERAALARGGTLQTTASLVWLELCRRPESKMEELAAQLSLTSEQVRDAVEQLESEGRIERKDGRLEADALVIPVGAAAGWEVAFFDHFQTVCVALATKLTRGASRSHAGDTTGGQTVTFEIDDDHPAREDVLGHLDAVRRQTNELWKRVEEHNAQHPHAKRKQVRFYVGQVDMPLEHE